MILLEKQDLENARLQLNTYICMKARTEWSRELWSRQQYTSAFSGYRLSSKSPDEKVYLIKSRTIPCSS